MGRCDFKRLVTVRSVNSRCSTLLSRATTNTYMYIYINMYIKVNNKMLSFVECVKKNIHIIE